MKRVLFYLLTFCLLLCGTNIYAHGTSLISAASQHDEVRKAASFEIDSLYVYNTSTSISHVKEPAPTILAMEDQNEDEDIIKKHLAISKVFAALTYAFLLNYSSSSISEHLSAPRDITGAASCKYIFQRVLRI